MVFSVAELVSRLGYAATRNAVKMASRLSPLFLLIHSSSLRVAPSP
jgi:hypothetical protein